MKFDVIVADCPWGFDDKLEMTPVKRGAEAQYDVLDIEAIKALKVVELAQPNAVLALWVPSSLLQEGLDTMAAWGFRQTQTHIWVKIKKSPFGSFCKDFLKVLKKAWEYEDFSVTDYSDYVRNALSGMDAWDLNEILAFGMGRLFRQTHEVCLLGVRGKIYDKLMNKSQRSVHFDINQKHSAKPEILQDRLEIMFPNTAKLEMFARRDKNNWMCVGNECPSSINEDIRDSIDRLIKL